MLLSQGITGISGMELDSSNLPAGTDLLTGKVKHLPIVTVEHMALWLTIWQRHMELLEQN